MIREDIIKNRFKIIVPYIYGKQKLLFEKYFHSHLTVFSTFGFEFLIKPLEVDMLLSHVSEMLEQVLYYDCDLRSGTEPEAVDGLHLALDRIEVYHFPTNIGFITFEIGFDNSMNITEMIRSMNKMLSSIETGKGEYDDSSSDYGEKLIVSKMESILEVLKELELFPTTKRKSCFWYQMLIAKINEAQAFSLRHINDDGTVAIGYMPTRNDDVETELKIDKLHECHLTAKGMGLITNLNLAAIMDSPEDKRQEKVFRSEYNMSFFLAFLLLQHERLLLLSYKKSMLTLKKNGHRASEDLKTRILNCLSCYTFQSISDDANCQLIYSGYRGLLKLSQDEEIMSNIIFKIDDELGKKKEKKVTVLSLLLATLGIVSIVSSVLDIITFFMDK